MNIETFLKILVVCVFCVVIPFTCIQVCSVDRVDNEKIVIIENPNVLEDKRTMEVTVSAYCPEKCCCGKWSDGKTATGSDAYTKGVAVDPKVIPYGSIVYVPEYGAALADDCGGAIKGDKIDVRFRTHREAIEWGKRRKHITIFRR